MSDATESRATDRDGRAPHTAHGEAQRQALARAAYQIIAESGFEGLRTRDVAAQRPQTREQDHSSPATALVFRDRHVEEVQNYAIAGETLWVLKEQSSKKIPLAQLDLEATARMNNDRGVDFQIPK